MVAFVIQSYINFYKGLFTENSEAMSAKFTNH